MKKYEQWGQNRLHRKSILYLKHNSKEQNLHCFCGDKKSEDHDLGFNTTGHVVLKCRKITQRVYVNHVF